MTCWGREGKRFLGLPLSKAHQGKSTSKEKYIKGKIYQRKIHQGKIDQGKEHQGKEHQGKEYQGENGEKVRRGKIYGRKERLYRKM